MMTPAVRRVGFVGLTAAFAVVAFALWTRLRPPATYAIEDAGTARAAVLKRTYGAVVYIGRDEQRRYDYFRTGRVFTTYYKVNACQTKLPSVFPLGRRSYDITAENILEAGIDCDRYEWAKP
jgi:hypothetical protein